MFYKKGALILRRIDVISTINRRGFDMVCSLGYWNEYKAKSDNKHTENEFRYFFKTNFAAVNGVFVLIYSNQDLVSQKFKTRRSYLPKSVVKVYNVLINRKKMYDLETNSNIKCYENIRKLTEWQGADYNTACLLDYDYFKSQCRLIAVDLSRRKELNSDPKAIQ